MKRPTARPLISQNLSNGYSDAPFDKVRKQLHHSSKTHQTQFGTISFSTCID